MKLLKKALLYDISNMAYLIADTGEPLNHTLHRVRDICEEGNIDRVSRILALAYSQIMKVLSPLIISPKIDINKDFSALPRDYEINFRDDRKFKHLLTIETKLKIKETSHEYMVSKVLADWLAVTLPEASDVWKERSELAIESLKTLCDSLNSTAGATFRRRLNPF